MFCFLLNINIVLPESLYFELKFIFLWKFELNMEFSVLKSPILPFGTGPEVLKMSLRILSLTLLQVI